MVLYYLRLRQTTLAGAESCTGGLISERITSVPGSSRSFLGGAIVYSNQLKISFANVAPDLISQHGAVSEEVAKALAFGIRQRTGATLGLGITGVAGPTGGTEAKPVGLTYIAVSDAQKTEVMEHRFRQYPPRRRSIRRMIFPGSVIRSAVRPVSCSWPTMQHLTPSRRRCFMMSTRY